jgi:predicted permease
MKSAAYAMWPLLSRQGWDITLAVEGHQGKDGEDMQAYYNLISPGYWETMGVPLLEGRDFDDRDLLDSTDPQQLPTVAIVNRAFAEHFFGAQSPVGRHIGCCRGAKTKTDIEIVGVAADSLFGGPRAGIRRQVFFFYPQAPYPHSVSFYVRTDRESSAIFGTIRNTVTRLDSSIPIYEMKTLDSQLDETLSTERLIASLASVFGALATVMAALGLYGVMAFAVTRRTKEIGLRMALGARQRTVLWLVLREVLILLGVGLLIGVPSAYLLNRYISAQLFGVAPTDAGTCGAAIAILAMVAAISGFVPARRASSIDPITALRYE